MSLKTSCGAFLASMRGVASASCVVSFISGGKKYTSAKIFEFRLLFFKRRQESRAREKISSSPIPLKSQTAEDMGPQQRALKPSQILGAILLASLCLFVTYKSTYFASNALSGGGGGGDEKKIGRKKSLDVEELENPLDAIEAARERIRETASKYREGDTSTLQGIKENKVSRENLLNAAERADERMMMTTNGDEDDVETKNEANANLVRIFGEEDFPIENEKCWPNEHSGYDGFALTWGMTFRTKTASECCDACRKHADICGSEGANSGTMFFNTSFGVQGHCGTAPFEKKLLCNIWVYCPPNEKRDGKCWSGDIHDHEQHECWLKNQANPTKPIAPSSGRYPEAHLQEHKTSPEVVQWLSGAIVKPGETVVARDPHWGMAANEAI